MSRKLLLTTIFGLLIILGAVLWFFFSNSAPTAPATTSVNSDLPFGQGGVNIPLGTPTNPSVTGVDSQGKPTSKLFRITDQPVAGMVSLNKAGSLVVRFVDRATGHVYDVDPTTLTKTQITNNTYPKIQEAYFKNDGSSVLLRDLKNDSDTVENISLALTAPKATTTDTLYSVKTTYLNGDVGDISVGPTNSLVFGLKDSGAISTSLFDGTKIKNLFSSSFTDWIISWPTTNNVSLTTKASSGMVGYSYNLNTSNGGLTKTVGPLSGLTTLANPAGEQVLYSYIDGGKTLLSVINIKTKTSLSLFPVTLAEKCIWSSKQKIVIFCGSPENGIGTDEPDNWYQGLSHFADQIWEFDTVSGNAGVIANPKKDFGVDIDAINLTLAPDESYLFFINKTDLTLWALKLQ